MRYSLPFHTISAANPLATNHNQPVPDVIRSQEPRIFNLDPPPRLKGKLQQQNLAFLDQLNKRHLRLHPGEAELEARIASYELAAACRPPPRRPSTSRRSPSTSTGCTASTRTRPARTARGA